MTHPDSEVLAEFRAGLVTGRRGARISAHLAACARCTGVCDQLAEISALLAAVPLAAGGYGLSRIAGSSTSSVAAGSEAASAASSAQAGAAAVPSSTAASGRGAVPAIEAPVTFGIVTSTTDYHRATLAQQLERELRQH